MAGNEILALLMFLSFIALVFTGFPVALIEHHRQPEQGQKNNRGPDNPGGRGEHQTDERNGNCQPATNSSEQARNTDHQLISDPRAVQQ